MRETNGNFDSCNSCKRLGTSRLHELHESKFPFVSRIEFIRSKLSNFSAHVYWGAPRPAGAVLETAGQPQPASHEPKRRGFRPNFGRLVGVMGCNEALIPR